MIENILFCLIGVFVFIATYFLFSSFINQEKLLKPNYLSRNLASTGGLILVFAIVEFSFFYLFYINRFHQYSTVDMLLESTFLFMILSVALVGFFDDTLGDKDSQGFKGHIKELLKANITTGAIKLIGIPLIIACGLAVTSQENGIAHYLLDVITVALFVNTFNLFDLSPGRTSKIALVVMLTILMIGTFASGYYAMFGMIVACCIFDTKEKFMLGDTGSNVIGLIVGLGVVSISNPLFTVIICLGLFGLNLLSEFVSFSKIINETMPLRVLDEIGQTSERIEYNKTKRSK